MDLYFIHGILQAGSRNILDGRIYIGGNAITNINDRFSPEDMNSYKTQEGKTDNVIYTYDANTKTAKLYINSHLVSTKIYSCETNKIQYFFSGTANYKTYNDILIYNRALTKDEVDNNYQIDKTKFNLEDWNSGE